MKKCVVPRCWPSSAIAAVDVKRAGRKRGVKGDKIRLSIVQLPFCPGSFDGFVYQGAHFSSDRRSIEITVRPRKGSNAICSRCHQLAPGKRTLRRKELSPAAFNRGLSAGG